MKTNADQIYLDLVKTILEKGTPSDDRTNVGTISLFGPQMEFNLEAGFPLLTTKRVPFRLIASELCWFLKGDTNIKYLLENNNNIWNEWGFENWVRKLDVIDNKLDSKDVLAFKKQYLVYGPNHRLVDTVFAEQYDRYMTYYTHNVLKNPKFAEMFGDLGPVYGKQWRNFNGVDQLDQLVHQLKTNPNSRRLIISAWNPEEVNDMALPPCHTLCQFYVRDNKLSCKLYQRSADIFLGVPFNIASYALLTHILAKQAGLKVGKFVHTFGDAHIYKNHIDQITQQAAREPKDMPTLKEFEYKPFDQYHADDFELENYQPHAGIKAPVAV